MFWKSRSHSSVKVNPGWYLAWGCNEDISDIIWRDDRVAIARIQPAFSPTHKKKTL